MEESGYRRFPFRGLSLLLLFLVCSNQTSVSRAQAVRPTFEEILGAYEAACGFITSYDIYLRITPTVLLHPHAKGPRFRSNPNQTPKNMFCLSRQYYSSGRQRADLLQSQDSFYPAGTMSLLWDGSTSKNYEAVRRAGAVSPVPEFVSKPNRITFSDLFMTRQPGFNYVDLIRSRAPTSRSVTREGNLVILTVEPSLTLGERDPSQGLSLYLDASRSFMPAKVDLFLKRFGVYEPWERYENELAEITPGLWVPARSIRRSFSASKDSEYYGKEMAFDSIELDTKRSRFNVPVEDGVFKLEFAIGTEVNDRVKNSVYRVGTGNKQTYLDQLAVMGRLTVDDLKRSDPRYLSEIRRTFPVWLNVLTGALTLGVLIVGTIVCKDIFRLKGARP